MLFIKKYKFVVEEDIQGAFDIWLKRNMQAYAYDIMREISGVRFRVYSVWSAFISYQALKTLIDNELEKLRKESKETV